MLKKPLVYLLATCLLFPVFSRDGGTVTQNSNNKVLKNDFRKDLESQIGDPMPQPKGRLAGFHRGNKIFLAIYKIPNGPVTEIKYYKKCSKGIMYPHFSLYDIQGRMVYLDNTGKDNEPDGFIDEIFDPMIVKRDAGEDGPSCPEEK